jgi:hypothetical protein
MSTPGEGILNTARGVAQTDSALRLGRRGRRFESGRPDRSITIPNHPNRFGMRAFSAPQDVSSGYSAR